jgi:hypothetical protein
MSRPSGRWIWVMSIVVAVAWLGLYVHNIAELPGQSLISPESFGPLIFSATLFAIWFWWRRIGAWLLLVWAAVNVLGAILTVLPLPILPFEPEQSVSHYLFHVLYGATQLPLIWAAIASLRATGSRESGAPPPASAARTDQPAGS